MGRKSFVKQVLHVVGVVEGLWLLAGSCLLNLLLGPFFASLDVAGFLSWPFRLHLALSALNSHNANLFLVHLENWLLLNGWELLFDLRTKVLATFSDFHEIDHVAADSLGNRVVELSQLCILKHCTHSQVLLLDQLEESSKCGKVLLGHPIMCLCELIADQDFFVGAEVDDYFVLESYALEELLSDGLHDAVDHASEGGLGSKSSVRYMSS